MKHGQQWKKQLQKKWNKLILQMTQLTQQQPESLWKWLTHAIIDCGQEDVHYEATIAVACVITFCLLSHICECMRKRTPALFIAHNRCLFPSWCLVHILISLHYHLVHSAWVPVLLFSLSFAVSLPFSLRFFPRFCLKGFLNWKHNWSAFTWTFPSSKCHKINHKYINAA